MLCVAYFYAVDRTWLSTRQFAPIFHLLMMFYDVDTAWLCLGVCLLAACWRKPDTMLRIVDALGNHPRAAAAAAVAVAAAASHFIYHDNALSMDEYAAVFQARVFALGRLDAQVPPALVDWLVPPGFNGAFLIASRQTGQIVENYYPGFSLLLAPFEFAKLGWLCNPLLAGFGVWLIHSITLEISRDSRSAGWAVLFTVASSAFLANAMSYYSMQAHLTANLLYCRLLLEPTNKRCAAAGVVGSWALVLHNPFPHTLFAIPWLVAFARDREQRRFLVPLLAGYLPLCLLLGYGWLQFRGGVTAHSAGVASLAANIHGMFEFPHLWILNMRVAALVKMLIWSVPGLFVLAVLGRSLWAENRHVRLLGQSALLTFAGYLCVVVDQGHGWGYRYFHSAWGVIPVLAGCAFTERKRPPARLVAFAGAAAVLSLGVLLPFQMRQIESVISEHSAQIPPPRRPGNNVYFVSPGAGFYLGDLIQMDPALRQTDLLLATRGEALDRELVRQNWPNAVEIAHGPTLRQWYLGPLDRRTTTGANEDPRWSLHFDQERTGGSAR